MLSNAQIKQLAALKQKKYRTLENRSLIEGVRLCTEALASGREIEMLLVEPDSLGEERLERFVSACRKAHIAFHQVSKRGLEKLKQTVSPQGVMAVVKTRAWSLTEILQRNPSTLIAVESIRDPGNLGTIVRTAAWFGMDGILLGGNCVEVSNPKVVRASMGAAFHLAIAEGLDLGAELSRPELSDFSVCLADVSAKQDYGKMNFKRKTILVLGGETAGFTESLLQRADHRLQIPLAGRGDSLNVAVAAGILMAELAKKGA